MPQFNTDQWLIFNYPPGSGGKFLTACFFQFDRVASWTGVSRTPNETAQWYLSTLPKSVENDWTASEIDTPWILPGISRAWAEGTDVTEHEFNSRLQLSPPPLFLESWNRDKIITDFWHKGYVPSWWTNATWISIVIDDVDLYKKLMFSKLYRFDKLNKTVTFPALQKKVDRKWYWDNIQSTEEFYNQVVKNYHWYKTWDFSKPIGNHCINLSDLFDIDCVYKFVGSFEDIMQQTTSRKYIETIHTEWCKLTLEKIECINLPK